MGSFPGALCVAAPLTAKLRRIWTNAPSIDSNSALGPDNKNTKVLPPTTALTNCGEASTPLGFVPVYTLEVPRCPDREVSPRLTSVKPRHCLPTCSAIEDISAAGSNWPLDTVRVMYLSPWIDFIDQSGGLKGVGTFFSQVVGSKASHLIIENRNESRYRVFVSAARLLQHERDAPRLGRHGQHSDVEVNITSFPDLIKCRRRPNLRVKNKGEVLGGSETRTIPERTALARLPSPGSRC
jgi:hypothetical protein